MKLMGREFKMPWGKYRNETLESIYVVNVDYLDWLLDKINRKEPEEMSSHDAEIKENIETCFKEMRSVKVYR